MKTLSAILHRFVRNLWRSVKDNLPLHAMAIVLTFVIAISGLDWFLNRLVAHRIMTPLDGAVTRPGMLVPAFVPIIVWVLGMLAKNKTIRTTGLLLGQSALIAFIVQSVYKAFTGRVPPYFSDLDGEDFSLLFRFGFLNGGIQEGWPSGHTLIAFAMAVSLVKFLPEKKWLCAGALSYAAFMAIGMSNTGLHFLSDIVAGMLIGIGIGITVGQSYNDRRKTQTSE